MAAEVCEISGEDARKVEMNVAIGKRYRFLKPITFLKCLIYRN